jgi:hypothetical protein
MPYADRQHLWRLPEGRSCVGRIDIGFGAAHSAARQYSWNYVPRFAVYKEVSVPQTNETPPTEAAGATTTRLS